MLSSCNFDFEFVQKIKSPDEKYNFCLYKSNGIKAEDFMVLKLEKSIDPKTIKIDLENSDADANSNSKAEWILLRQMLANYEESSDFASNPRIELISNRFLVFSRGSYDFSLYDLKLNKDTFNECCPFGKWARQNIQTKNGANYKSKIPNDEKSDYGIWIEKNIDSEIKKYIQTNKEKDQ